MKVDLRGTGVCFCGCIVDWKVRRTCDYAPLTSCFFNIFMNPVILSFVNKARSWTSATNVATCTPFERDIEVMGAKYEPHLPMRGNVPRASRKNHQCLYLRSFYISQSRERVGDIPIPPSSESESDSSEPSVNSVSCSASSSPSEPSS